MAVTINGVNYQSADAAPCPWCGALRTELTGRCHCGRTPAVKARKRPPPQRAAAHRDRTKYDRKRIQREED